MSHWDIRKPPLCTPLLVDGFSTVPRLQWGLWYGRSQMTNKTKQTNKFLLSVSILFLPFLSISVSSIALKSSCRDGIWNFFFLLCFFLQWYFFNLISLLWIFISSRDVKYFLVYFLLLFLEWKILHLFSSQISHSIFNSPPLLFLLFHSLHWKFKSSQDGTFFFPLFCFRVCSWINTSPKFLTTGMHGVLLFFSFNFLLVLWQTQAPNFITIPGSGSLQFLLNQQVSQLVWWGQGKDSYQRNISIASSFFTGANFSNVATKKPKKYTKKNRKKISNLSFLAKYWTF